VTGLVTVVVTIDEADAGRVQALFNACLVLNGYQAGAGIAVEQTLEEHVPWHRAKELITDLHETLRETGTHGADQVQAYATGFLDQLEVNVREPRVLYETLAVIALVRACARNGHANEIITHEVEEVVASVCRALATALAVLAPAEARA
jgi:hypothetical protein